MKKRVLATLCATLLMTTNVFAAIPTIDSIQATHEDFFDYTDNPNISAQEFNTINFVMDKPSLTINCNIAGFDYEVKDSSGTVVLTGTSSNKTIVFDQLKTDTYSVEVSKANYNNPSNKATATADCNTTDNSVNVELYMGQNVVLTSNIADYKLTFTHPEGYTYTYGDGDTSNNFTAGSGLITDETVKSKTYVLPTQGLWTVTATKTGYLPITQDINVSDADYNLDLVFQIQLTGTVVNQFGTPVNNFNVAYNGANVYTDNTGKFVVTQNYGADAFDLVLSLGNYTTFTMPSVERSISEDLGTITVHKEFYTVTGKALDKKGNPIPNGKVTIMGVSGTTDANGNYSINIPLAE